MRISDAEQQAIKTVVELGGKFGFGNLMAHLASAWAIRLMEQYDMPESTALNAVDGRSAYPLAMHKDLIERGEWDEAGKRYRKPPAESPDDPS